MLKLERLSAHGRVRSAFFDHALVRALIFSALAHIVVVCSIRIKMFEFSEPGPTRPIAVAIESDGQAGAHALVDLAQNRSQAPIFTNALDDSSWQALCLAAHPTPSDEQAWLQPQTTTLQSQITDAALTAPARPITYQVHLYPLQLKFSSSLKTLKLVDDGSSLFKVQTASNIYPITSSHYSIEYHVEVEGSTGKILRSSPKKELVDKKLQEVADRIMHILNFARAEDTLYAGSIWLNFCCSGEKIGEYLE